LDPRALETHGLRQLQPRFDAPGIITVAVVIEDALHPMTALGAVVAVGQDRGVLEWNVHLVIETVRHPASDLLRPRAAAVQHHVEGMMNVIAPILGAQLTLELRPAPGSSAHSSISMPSQATSIPRRPSSARSAASSSRMG